MSGITIDCQAYSAGQLDRLRYMLRRMSRASQRQLHEVAAGVVQAADLQRFPDSRPTIRPAHLHVTASHDYPSWRPLAR